MLMLTTCWQRRLYNDTETGGLCIYSVRLTPLKIKSSNLDAATVSFQRTVQPKPTQSPELMLTNVSANMVKLDIYLSSV